MAVATHDEFTTTDTSLATYLLVEGFTLLRIDYSQPRFEYAFENNSGQLQEHATRYVTGKALVDPATFTRVNRKLLRIINKQIQWEDEA